jgi:hypothetical protein
MDPSPDSFAATFASASAITRSPGLSVPTSPNCLVRRSAHGGAETRPRVRVAAATGSYTCATRVCMAYNCGWRSLVSSARASSSSRPTPTFPRQLAEADPSGKWRKRIAAHVHGAVRLAAARWTGIWTGVGAEGPADTTVEGSFGINPAFGI